MRVTILCMRDAQSCLMKHVMASQVLLYTLSMQAAVYAVIL